MNHLTTVGRKGKAFCGKLGTYIGPEIEAIDCLRCLHAYRNWLFSRTLRDRDKRIEYTKVCHRIWFLTDAKRKKEAK